MWTALINMTVLIEFGETEISLLIQHYEPVLEWAKVKVDEIETEWNMLKAELYNR